MKCLSHLYSASSLITVSQSRGRCHFNHGTNSCLPNFFNKNSPRTVGSQSSRIFVNCSFLTDPPFGTLLLSLPLQFFTNLFNFSICFITSGDTEVDVTESISCKVSGDKSSNSSLNSLSGIKRLKSNDSNRL